MSRLSEVDIEVAGGALKRDLAGLPFTLRRIQTHLRQFDGTLNPLAVAVMSSPPTVTSDAGTDAYPNAATDLTKRYFFGSKVSGEMNAPEIQYLRGGEKRKTNISGDQSDRPVREPSGLFAPKDISAF